MIVTEAGIHANVSALVYVAARAPDADEDYTALAKMYPAPPATADIVFDGDEGRLSEKAFLRHFAGDLPEAKARVLYAVASLAYLAVIGRADLSPAFCLDGFDLCQNARCLKSVLACLGSGVTGVT